MCRPHRRCSWPRTKLHPPTPRADALPRLRLFETLQTTISTSRVTLISAPAGCGKTTLLSCLVRSRPDLTVAWVALDEDDDDLVAFFVAVTAALGVLKPGFGRLTQAVLGGAAQPVDRPRGRECAGQRHP